jgi:Carboxypeptidase regulatory-like domain
MPIILFFFFLAAAFAQPNSTGAVSGSVRDAENLALPQAQIQLANASGFAQSTKSAANGGYSFSGIPAGAYTLTSELPGMIKYQAAVTIEAGKTLQSDIRMRDFNSNVLGEDRESIATLFNPPNIPTGPAPRAADGKPDLSGVWRPAALADPGKPELLPWAAAVVKERIANNNKDNPFSQCLPAGMLPGVRLSPFKIVQTPTLIVILFETGDYPRQVFLDRSHPEDPNPTWAGHSIGRWDGDTLVIDTVGFNDKAWIVNSDPHTEKLHLIERFRRLDAGHLEMAITFDDPGTYAKPWTLKRISPLAPKGEDLEEFICNENNRDLGHLVGK